MRNRFISLIGWAVLCAAFFVLLGLGSWQMTRLDEKQTRIKAIEMRTDAPPFILDAIADFGQLSQDAHDYHPVRLEGVFLHEKSIRWFAQIIDPPRDLPRQDYIGFHLITPMKLPSGRVILVDRGFIPEGFIPEGFIPKDYDMKRAHPRRRVVLEAILHWPDRRTIFSPRDNIAENIWYVRDSRAIGAHLGLSLPVFLAETRVSTALVSTALVSDGDSMWPRGGQTRIVLTNRHLEYAFTWYGLAIVLVIIVGIWHMRRKRQTGKME